MTEAFESTPPLAEIHSASRAGETWDAEDLSLGVIPARSQKDWTVVASAAQAKDTTVLTPAAPVTTRFLLVYLTSLPPELGNYYQGGISNIEVRP